MLGSAEGMPRTTRKRKKEGSLSYTQEKGEKGNLSFLARKKTTDRRKEKGRGTIKL